MTNGIKLRAEPVEKIYSGRDHVCRCGCAGKYYYSNDKMFQRILKRAVAKSYEQDVDIDEQPTYVNISYDNDRAYTIYYK